ncbi:MAG: hypothetical protein EXQ56_11630 [Acidobacteria bacterium]|nr:hypothetical protein [Acidobacteriota bacterium]
MNRIKIFVLLVIISNLTAGAAETSDEVRGRLDQLRGEVARLSSVVEEQGREIEMQRALLVEQQREQKKNFAAQQAAINAVMQELAAPRVPAIGMASAGSGAGYTLSAPAAFTTAGTPATATAQVTGQGAGEGGDLSGRVQLVEKNLADTRKALEDRMRGFGPFSFSGDFRYRHEPFFGGGPSDGDSLPDRFRNRLRLRINATTRFDDEFSGGIMLASGIGGNPVSANQDLTGYFTEKPFSIDKAFVSYNPRWMKPLRITAGKWAYTFQRTQMMWDNDLNPEGVTEALTFNWKDSPLQRLELIGFQTVMLESGSGPDTSLLGWQARTEWGLGSRVKLGAAMTFFDYNNEASLASNVNQGNGSYDAGQPTGLGGNYGFGGSALTNSFGTINGVRTLASKYGILDVIARLDINTGTARWPLMIEGDFAQNTRACQNLGAFARAGAATPACNARDRQAYWVETILGRNQDKGDFALGYTFARIERDSLLSNFNFSNFRQGTNHASHRAEIVYSVNRNVTGTARAIIGRQLGTVPGAAAGTRVVERNLTRLQFDLIYRY